MLVRNRNNRPHEDLAFELMVIYTFMNRGVGGEGYRNVRRLQECQMEKFSVTNPRFVWRLKQHF